jgi:serine phosphatase RsbU (regulator of sigma subunit)/uncharacterized protein HemY
MKIILRIVFTLFIGISCFSQTRETDSLYNKLKTSRRDTIRVQLFNQLSEKLNTINPTISLRYAQKARLLAELLSFKDGIIKAHSNIGIVYYRRGDYSSALESFFTAEKLLESHPNNSLLSDLYNNMALVYVDIDKLSVANDYFNKSIKIDTETKHYEGLADSYNNLGSIYALRKELVKAKNFFELSLKYRQISHDDKLPYTLLNLGSINRLLDNLSTASRQINQALLICQRNDDIIGVASVYNEIGDLKIAQKKYQEAISYLTKSLALSKQFKLKNQLLRSYESLSTAYELTNNYKKAYYYFKEKEKLKDKIFSIANARNLIEMQTKYESEKRKQELLKTNSEIDKKNFQINVFRIGFILIVLLVFFIIYNLREKSKINKIILKQKQAVEIQNKIIEEKNILVETQNKDIKDSIKYAQRIQEAILPPKPLWNKILPNSFVIYQPKDILSGDFNWIAETETHIFVAAADCTGHGVPGALISLVNYNLLNKAVLEKGIIKTGEILNAVNNWLTESLHQEAENSTVKDGMDISLISINKETNQVQFSGAFNSLYIVNEQELRIIKGDKFPVGSFFDEEINLFNTIDVEYQKGDLLYMFTDGYPDQFGGSKGKKYKHNRLKENMSKIVTYSLEDQRSFLLTAFYDWKGDFEQVDDVLLIGLKM